MSMFTMLPFSSASEVMPILSQGSWAAYGLSPEGAALDHWLFGGSDACLTGIQSGTLLTPQGASHSYSGSSVTIPSWGGALVSSIADMAEMTMVAVIQRPPVESGTNSVIVMGTLGYSGGASLPDGSSIHIASAASGSVRQNVKGMYATHELAYPEGLSIGEWAFVAGIEKSGVHQDIYIGGAGLDRYDRATAKVVATRGIALGNAYYDVSTYKSIPLVASEFILFDWALSETEIGEVYQRSTQRMSKRGITLF